ncbi:MAG: metal-dependent hydrolase [Actinobacteria bacterium]|nr:metal-dependent hydrolase [Actinomycetota bacterium]
MPVRRTSFEESLRDIPKHWAQDGNIFLSHLGVAMSGVFPDGEDFFVKSVRHFRDQITDPALKKQVAGFIGQESVHGREHRVLNRRFAELGYRSAEIEAMTKKALAFRWRVSKPITCLAITAALEHFTAALAEELLSNDEFRSMFGHPAVEDVFMWHALEESEHKAVAFDVYRAVGGTERLRVNAMRFIRIGFIVSTVVVMALGILRDPAARDLKRLRRDFSAFRRSPIIDPRLWAILKEYDRPGFHPNDRDTVTLTAKWREKLFGAEGELNHVLANSAA